MFQIHIIVLIVILNSFSAVNNIEFGGKTLRKFVRDTKQHVFPRMGKKLHKLHTMEVCYDTVGCFEIPRHHNPLQKIPESPQLINTQFFLFRRNINFTTPEILTYNDHFVSLNTSKFDPNAEVKILIHGYMTRWNEIGALAGAKAYLNIGDYNVIIMNWERGARGPSYGNAAANTELVGRQLGFLLLDMANLGVDLAKIHLIGFSLGAHVAACASQQLKDQGLLIGRITGLDPASPLFKLDHFRDNKKKLDISDAKYVDVIHTDGSPVFTDGFGILQPLGHVDYFPNGGREQPGCNDLKASVLRSHIDKSLDREVACSHIRAYKIFLETLVQKATGAVGCEFMAYKCPKGLKDFTTGHCFPSNNGFRHDLGKLGEDSYGEGPMYLVTRSSPPFCGVQIQASVTLSALNLPTRGVLFMKLQHGNQSTSLQMNIEILEPLTLVREIHALGTADFGSFNRNITEITAQLFYTIINVQETQYSVHNSVIIEEIAIKDLQGNQWRTCEPLHLVQDKSVPVKLIQ